MPRQPRVAPPGRIYHVMNRAAGRYRMLRRDDDFAALQRILVEAAPTATTPGPSRPPPPSA